MQRIIKTFLVERKVRKCHPGTYSKRMSKENSLNRKDTIKKEIWDIRKEEKTWKGKYTDFPFPFEFSKLCLMIETKVITLSNVVLKANYDDK